MQDEAVLVEKVLAGNREAFEPLVRKYAPRIYRVVLRMVHHSEDARDLTQEIFFQVYRKLSSYQPDRRFSTWLYQIAVNRCIDELRKRKGKRLVALNDEWVSNEPGPEKVAIDRMRVDDILKSLDGMPENWKLIFLLRFVDDLSYSEIAEVLGISLNDVRNGLYRTRQKLRMQFQAKEGAG
ncbi:RNA polymerase sigma factor [Staphylospora marina]|uniref:RNA polymerase sigma factor n=1 Tax=Staphylospora marina TaxID=2490858 RepID=UPI000F5BE866|nr:sigma-70 family RNA polymerase sigma factor [Staphylospora marina]